MATGPCSKSRQRRYRLLVSDDNGFADEQWEFAPGPRSSASTARSAVERLSWPSGRPPRVGITIAIARAVAPEFLEFIIPDPPGGGS